MLAAQIVAHTGATSKASTVKSARATAPGAGVRVEIVSDILLSSRYVGALETSPLARRRGASIWTVIPANQPGLWLCSPKSQRRKPFGNFDNRPSPARPATEDAAQSNRYTTKPKTIRTVKEVAIKVGLSILHLTDTVSPLTSRTNNTNDFVRRRYLAYFVPSGVARSFFRSCPWAFGSLWTSTFPANERCTHVK